MNRSDNSNFKNSPGNAEIPADSSRTKLARLFWPEGVLGPLPRLKEINVACWTASIGFLFLPLCYLTYLHVRDLHLSDFVYFYGIGAILRDHGSYQLYDLATQQNTFNELEPPHGFTWGPSPYPPYVALVFRAFAVFSFRFAYIMWSVISLACYLYGVICVLRCAFPKDPLRRSFILCLALVYSPFLLHTLMNGQLSAIAVFSTGMAYRLERTSKRYRCGISLAMLAYKPTLFLPLVAFCIVTRRFRTLYGMVTGAFLLAAGSTMVMGSKIWSAYAHFVAYFSQAIGLSGKTNQHLWQFVDLRSMLLQAGARDGRWAFSAFAVISVVFGLWLLVVLWNSAHRAEEVQSLAWAIALTWCLLINIYVPFYDATLAIIPMVLTLGATAELGWKKAFSALIVLAIAGVGISWMSESAAMSFNVQPLGLMLLTLGIWQGVLLQRAMRQNGMSSSEISADWAKSSVPAGGC